jgi:solute carrier family 35 (UDP-sugar transporter), member A1/2/3
VLLSTYLYSMPDRKRGRPPPVTVVSYEKASAEAGYTPRTAGDSKLMLLDPLESVKAVGLSTSRPSSPMLHHSRVPSARGKNRDE